MSADSSKSSDGSTSQTDRVRVRAIKRAVDQAGEVREVQNPALAAVMLWQFANSFASTTEERIGVPVPALFLVLPIVLHRSTLAIVLSTKPQSGLRRFALKLSEPGNGQSEGIIAIQSRAISLKRLSTEALQIAVSSGLLRVQLGDALAFATEQNLPTRLPDSLKELLRGASRLGAWFRPLSLSEISMVLDVRF